MSQVSKVKMLSMSALMLALALALQASTPAVAGAVRRAMANEDGATTIALWRRVCRRAGIR